MKQLIPMDNFEISENEPYEMRLIYVIETPSGCKIGVSKNPKERFQQLAIGSPQKYDRYWESPPCSNAFKIESIIHKKLATKKIKREWFNISFDDAIELIKSENLECKATARERHIDFTWDWYLEAFFPEVYKTIKENGFSLFEDNNSVWLESEDFGILSLEMFASIFASGILSGTRIE